MKFPRIWISVSVVFSYVPAKRERDKESDAGFYCILVQRSA